MKSAHFIPVRTDYSLDRLAELYISEIVRLHERSEVHIVILEEITSSPRLTVQAERVIQILEDMLRCCILEFEGSWEKYLPLIEFAYNKNFQTNIKMALYETELSEKKIHGVELIRETEEKVKMILDNLKAASDRQKSYADLKHKEIEF
ncbi:reverse transcriptase [Gossypium australe]|uniref:Reverse transcriptase n=1 Tax=Gossypium australe TaxID=47621 RepID=A0A5B6WZD8_9ROSI|nr:reverse transcriptase [Gossypium australe]